MEETSGNIIKEEEMNKEKGGEYWVLMLVKNRLISGHNLECFLFQYVLWNDIKSYWRIDGIYKVNNRSTVIVIRTSCPEEWGAELKEWEAI